MTDHQQPTPNRGRQVSRALRAVRHTNERGFVLPSAIIILLILTLLTGTAIAIATQSSTSTTRDDNVKAELEAAEAGLHIASYRLGQLKPTEAQCIGENKVATEESKCTDSAESLGNGASFRYWTTLPLKAGAKCSGRAVEIVAGTTQRCITAEGKVNGVAPAARLQALATATAGETLFSVKGIVGLSEVNVSGSVKVPALVASNGTIKVSGGGELAGGYELGPKGKFVHEGGGKWSPPEKKRTEAEGPIVAKLPTGHATAASNEDSRIGKEDEFFTEGKAVNNFTGSPSYELKIGSNGKLTLGTGGGSHKYYLCNFAATNNSRLKIPSGAKVEIFVDSPSDPESKCKAGTGKFEGEGEFKVENEGKNPAALLIEVYGAGPVAFHNGTTLEASIYAPEAEVALNGSTKFKGGIVGNKIPLEAGSGIFEWNEEVASLLGGSASAYGRKTWEQCTDGSGTAEGC
jgi:Tfp pilus assembly protein PilX